MELGFPNKRMVRTENWEVKKPCLGLNKETIVL